MREQLVFPFLAFHAAKPLTVQKALERVPCNAPQMRGQGRRHSTSLSEHAGSDRRSLRESMERKPSHYDLPTVLGRLGQNPTRGCSCTARLASNRAQKPTQRLLIKCSTKALSWAASRPPHKRATAAGQDTPSARRTQGAGYCRGWRANPLTAVLSCFLDVPVSSDGQWMALRDDLGRTYAQGIRREPRRTTVRVCLAYAWLD
ncbi:hypothetical protein BC628DRAFT_32211 [Trametes gibbosa]|nr:hypothetical protein BC628DRAFT_32211 [Trametes gibbosa]